MAYLNYQHLQYFWVVAREGSVNQASRILNVTASTISVQLKKLEEQFQQKLFRRVGRGLQLTDIGQVAYRYADSIFSTGQELTDYLEGRRHGGPLRLEIGVAQSLPKLVTWRLMEPVSNLKEPCHIRCREDTPHKLVDELVLHQLDVVISDIPLKVPNIKLFNHFLGESAVSFFAAPKLAKKLKRNFPKSLTACPVVLPSNGTEMRRSLDSWFSRNKIQPVVTAEFDDLALLKVAGEFGLGAFPVPTVVEKEVIKHYGVQTIGEAKGVIERFYAVSADRQIEHPAVMAMTHAAQDLFR